jgi:hypothetical protein
MNELWKTIARDLLHIQYSTWDTILSKYNSKTGWLDNARPSFLQSKSLRSCLSLESRGPREDTTIPP